MHDYWLMHYSGSALIHSGNPLKQVGKTVNGVEVGENQITLIVEHIASALDLAAADTLFDLCCGNGLLTVRLAEYAGSVTGFDFTQELLEIACKQHRRPNLYYQLVNVLALSAQQLASANRFCMYEALQHLTVEQFDQLMGNLRQLPAGTRFFIGGIPDLQRLRDFYDTDEKFRFYQEHEQAERPHLGRWWLEEEVLKAATVAGYSMKTLTQPEGLYTAHYRFDALLEKQR